MLPRKNLSFIFFLILIFFISLSTGFQLQKKYNRKIPKIIHYVWLGENPMPPSALLAIDSWKKYAPDYKIIKWDESNCNINTNAFVKKTYKEKRYAWASDYCRMYALNKYGGIYMDTDQYLKAPIQKLNFNKNLILTFEYKNALASSFIAATKNHPLIQEILKFYNSTNYMPNGPETLTMQFKKLFPNIPINGNFYTSRKIIIYPTNILIIDFGGGENIGEHMYDASSTPLIPGTYHHFFKRAFLEEHAIQINYKDNVALIKITPSKGYLYPTITYVDIIAISPQKMLLKQAGKEVIKFNKIDNIYMLEEKTEN